MSKSGVVWGYAPDWATHHVFNDPTCFEPGLPTGEWWSCRPQRFYGKCCWEAPGDGVPETAHMASGFALAPGGDWRVSVEKRPEVIPPIVVCLCGSTRFSEAFQRANLWQTLAGKIVLTIGCDMRSDHEIFGEMSGQLLAEIKSRLDELHLRKIDLADEVLILNVGGYIGESTARELAYAITMGKRVQYLEPPTKVAEGSVT